MIFSSLEFLCVFLPVVFALYCLLPSIKVKNALLIVASLLFYAYGEPVYVLLMIASSFMNYGMARLIAKGEKIQVYLLKWVWHMIIIHMEWLRLNLSGKTIIE